MTPRSTGCSRHSQLVAHHHHHQVPVRTGEGGKRKKVLLVRTKGGDVHALSHKCP